MNTNAGTGQSEEECLLVARLVKNGLPCFVIYGTGPDASPQEEKEVLDYFAGVFTVLDVRNFSQGAGQARRSESLRSDLLPRYLFHDIRETRPRNSKPIRK